MFSVALIGSDGAGKSTVAQWLESTFTLPVKTLYMGINVESSNVALPTSRLIAYVKQARRKKTGKTQAGVSLHAAPGAEKKKPSGKLWAAVRLFNNLAEEWYRQLLSWRYQRKGYIVVYDRHFQFDFEYDNGTKGQKRRLSDRIHRWCLAKLYPRPDLVIYLDAAAEVLFARKGEATLEWLESRRRSFLDQEAKTPGFIRVDATQPLKAVCREVGGRIMEFYEARQRGTTGSSHQLRQSWERPRTAAEARRD